MRREEIKRRAAALAVLEATPERLTQEMELKIGDYRLRLVDNHGHMAEPVEIADRCFRRRIKEALDDYRACLCAIVDEPQE